MGKKRQDVGSVTGGRLAMVVVALLVGLASLVACDVSEVPTTTSPMIAVPAGQTTVGEAADATPTTDPNTIVVVRVNPTVTPWMIPATVTPWTAQPTVTPWTIQPTVTPWTVRPIGTPVPAVATRAAATAAARATVGQTPPAPVAGRGGGSGPYTTFSEAMTMKYYPIIGRTAAELRAQINRLGPKDQNGQPFDGQTDAELRWSYQVATVENRCVVTTVNVHMQTTITMPQWTPPPDAPTELRERWAIYYAALLFHENNHKELGDKAGRQLVQQAAALPPAASCDDLKATLDDLAQQALAWLNQQNTRYDLATQHGRTEGARFP